MSEIMTGSDLTCLTRRDSNHVLTAHDACVNLLATIFDIVVVQGTTRGLATTLVNFEIDVTHCASCVVVVKRYPSFLTKEGVVQVCYTKARANLRLQRMFARMCLRYYSILL